MKTNRPKARERGIRVFGLVASGIAGDWEVSVDESVSDAQQWFLEIDGPAWYLDFPITGREVIREILGFFTAHLDACDSSGNGTQPATDEIQFTRCGSNTVSLIWDSEANGRCAVLVAGADGFHCRLTLLHDDLVQLVDALRQVEDEWND